MSEQEPYLDGTLDDILAAFGVFAPQKGDKPDGVANYKQELTAALTRLIARERAKAANEARRETITHIQEIAWDERDRGFGCHRIIGECDILLAALNKDTE